MWCAGPAPERRAAVARLSRRLAAHCQALAALPPSAAAVLVGGSQGPGAPGARRPDARRGPDGHDREGLGPATAHLLARRCLAEAAALAGALGGRYDAGVLGVLLLHLTAVWRWVAVLLGFAGRFCILRRRRAGCALAACNCVVAPVRCCNVVSRFYSQS